jgi:DNA invertase Pin-like site-specific DNA recombinase
VKIAIYSRVSTDGQDATNQLLQLRQHCAQQGWTITHEYVDVMSGGRSDREQLQQMLQDAAKRRFDAVLVWALDRLSREGAFATLAYLQRLATVGVKFVSYTEPYINTIGPLGDGIIALLGCFAKMEKDRLRERTLAGLAKARAAGRVGGRRHVISADDRERILRLRAEGLSFAKIASATGYPKSTIHLAVSEAQ